MPTSSLEIIFFATGTAFLIASVLLPSLAMYSEYLKLYAHFNIFSDFCQGEIFLWNFAQSTLDMVVSFW